MKNKKSKEQCLRVQENDWKTIRSTYRAETRVPIAAAIIRIVLRNQSAYVIIINKKLFISFGTNKPKPRRRKNIVTIYYQTQKQYLQFIKYIYTFTETLIIVFKFVFFIVFKFMFI